jgi:DNA-binding MarR family transcriptional regulator
MGLNKHNSLGYALTTTLNKLRKRFNNEVVNYNLSSEQYAVMKLVEDTGELTPTKVAELLDRDKATITRIVNSLEKKGYIKKEKINNRSFNIVLTDSGKNVIQKADEVALDIQKKIKSIISDEEFNKLLNNLFKIRDNL